ncbi:MAG: NAD-glutamate dehydrogenase, partial [Pseudonocardia sp.]|nr:NAD-glutamate dehydrogenase [Pseudonocardia sp.]
MSTLYARHAPDLRDGTTDRLPQLRRAVENHLRLAAERATGEPKVAVRVDPAAAGTSVEIVTDDMPFLVGSVLVAVAKAGTEVRRLVHPIVVVRRRSDGKLAEVLGDADPADPPEGAMVESWIHLDLDPLPGTTDDLEQAIARAVASVRRVVGDGEAMTDRALGLADRLICQRDESAAGGRAQFLHWLVDGHFAFIGHRTYSADGAPRDPGLGVLRDDIAAAAPFAPWTAAITGGDRGDIIVTRASAPNPLRATVHPYVIAVAERDEQGTVVGEDRFVGTLTVPAQFESVLDIPVIEQRVRDAIRTAGFPMESYSGQRMLEVISALPREELFSSSVERLRDTAVGVLAVTAQRAVRVFLRRDPFRRFISCLVYVPRDRYTTSSRLAMAEVLKHRLGGTSVDYTAGVSEARLAMVHFTVHAEPDAPGYGDVDTATLQDELADAVRTWEDRLLGAANGDGSAAITAALPGIPESYRAVASPERAVEDLRRIEGLSGPGDIGVRLYPGTSGEDRRFTFFLAGEPATLTAVLPVLQQLGTEVLDERPAELTRPDGLRVHVYDFGLRLDEPTRAAVAGRADTEIESGFCASFRAAWCGDAESDGFSALMLRAGLAWREVAVLRAYARYARQLGSPYGHQYMATTLLAFTPLARALMGLFTARFDPSLPGDRDVACDQALARVRELIDAVTGLDADRILRGFLGMITATLRTNYYRQRPFLSFKFDPALVPDMPAPRPKFEIFVYSPRVEGVHLRYGPVARGGLRWSDRPQDFRTEILGLVKAQAVKNAVIVPVGAKGGFYVRNAERGPAEVEACYRTFISGLLDLTDNLVDGTTVPPPDVVRHDGDDSYLVVAADKGTARFSDTANEVATSYGFWLGDAFASGGSVGYDHKAMGITAKGAWESVKRHFRELAVDTQSEEFTVVGIGDMSGDVFGNGMLLSPHIRLLAAFDHRHVFVDPDPDAATSFAERERMFALPRSSWDDYDRSLIS